jgi:hypothetical protein
MANIIKTKEFLIRLKNDSTSAVAIGVSDLLEITELGITIPFSEASNRSRFYDILKRAVSDFNSDAALNGNSPIDFDDLHTKYSEYVEVLKKFVQESE